MTAGKNALVIVVTGLLIMPLLAQALLGFEAYYVPGECDCCKAPDPSFIQVQSYPVPEPATADISQLEGIASGGKQGAAARASSLTLFIRGNEPVVARLMP
jgi:hypothetical protein